MTHNAKTHKHNYFFFFEGMGILMFIGCPVDDVAGLRRLDGYNELF